MRFINNIIEKLASTISMKVAEMTAFDKSMLTIKSTRHVLGSIDLKDIPDPDMDENDRRAYVQTVYSVYGNMIKKECDLLAQAQIEFGVQNATGDVAMAFTRGTLNGIYLVQQRFEDMVKEHQELDKKPEPFDPQKMFPALYDAMKNKENQE